MRDNFRFLRFTELVFGIPFIILVGSLLHFTYGLSGGNYIVGLFSAVNESVWEHLKLSFFPAFTLAIFQYMFLRREYPNFFLGKAVGILTTLSIIVAGYYGYESVFQGSNLTYDIGLFIAAIMVGQFVSYSLVQKHGRGKFNAVAFMVLLLLTAAFFVFTFGPPRLELFRDPVTGGYGVGIPHR